MAEYEKLVSYLNRKISENLKDNECNTGIIKLYTHDWTISNFGMINPVKEAARSPVFVVGLHNEAQLKMHLSPSADNNVTIEISLEETPKPVSLEEIINAELKQASKKNPFNKAILNLEFCNSDGKTLDYFMALPREGKHINRKEFYLWKKEENVERFLQNDSLTLRAKLSLRYSPKVSEANLCPKLKSSSILSEDMKKLIGVDNKFPDIVVKVGGQFILAHKAFLLTQIPELAKFNSDSSFDGGIPIESPIKSIANLTEKYETVSIPNENADVFLSVLHYLYCGNIHIADTLNDFGVYEFSKKYGLHELSMMLKPCGTISHSEINKLEVSFTWYVTQFSLISLDKFNLHHSPYFKTDIGTTKIVWKVSLYIFDAENICINLQRVEGLESNVMTKFKFIVRNTDGSVHDKREFKHFFTSNKISTAHPGFLDSESRFHIMPSLLFNDTLTICCELIVSNGEVTSQTQLLCHGEYPHLYSTCWSTNLKNLMDKETYSDVSFFIDGKEFRGHKAILSARSPVFERMFESDMAEKNSGCVKIDDVSSTTMKNALCYIYTGTLGDLSMHHAPELYRIADKYEIFDLKDRCSEFILENLDAESACEVLILSDLYNEQKMKKAAKNIICRRASETLLTPYGSELITNYPHLAHDILENLSAVYCSLPPQDTYEKSEDAGTSTSITFKRKEI